MENTDYWEAFKSSGNINDYLQYKNSAKQEVTVDAANNNGLSDKRG